jgi:hypothetical protein
MVPTIIYPEEAKIIKAAKKMKEIIGLIVELKENGKNLLCISFNTQMKLLPF